ncbi:MAG: AAA family ATPase [Planctomycetia bacterium]
MWVEQLTIQNVRSFESISISFTKPKEVPYRWITFVSENGGGKSTALQALGLLLAGPEGAQKLLPRPFGWLRDESRVGRIAARIHQDECDPGLHGKDKVKRAFGYSYSITGSAPLKVHNKHYTEPTIVPAQRATLTWLREKAFASMGTGWFAVGYGAFRRLTRSNQIIIPLLEPQARFTNFSTQFDEAEPLSIFELWMVYLDYRIAKERDPKAKRQKELGIAAINKLLPAGVEFDSVSAEGRVLFNIGSRLVPTISLSDGFRSILALAGDLIWRLILAFPESSDPLKEKGVVLIDELDIHLHPKWQRDVAGLLRETFPNLQFFVATHSPMIAAGAGADALTLKFDFSEGKSEVRKVENIASMSVDRLLQSDAFDLISPFSPEAQRKIDRFDELNKRKGRHSKMEADEYNGLFDFMSEAMAAGAPPVPGSLEGKIDAFLEHALNDKG